VLMTSAILVGRSATSWAHFQGGEIILGSSLIIKQYKYRPTRFLTRAECLGVRLPSALLSLRNDPQEQPAAQESTRRLVADCSFLIRLPITHVKCVGDYSGPRLQLVF